jgi:hypothetical protein
MRRMPGLICICTVAAVACAKKSDQAVDTTATAPAAAPAPAPAAAPAPAPAAMTFADVAGTWNMKAVPDSGTDTSATTFKLVATADSTGWKQTFSNGLTVPVHPMLMGDSIVLHSGPYASVRRKGVQVTTETSLRKEGDKLMGHTTAHYKTSKADSVLHLHSEGTKAP